MTTSVLSSSIWNWSFMQLWISRTKQLQSTDTQAQARPAELESLAEKPVPHQFVSLDDSVAAERWNPVDLL